MSKTFRFAALAGILTPVAFGLVTLPIASDGALAATKKAAATKKGSAMKGGAMKGGAMKSGAASKGKSADPLNAAAGKKM